MHRWVWKSCCLVLLVVLLVPASGRCAEVPPPVRLVLAKVGPMLAGKEYGRAAELLEAAMSRDEIRHAEIAFALGNCHLLGGNRAAAIRAYSQATALDGGHTHAWLNMAKAHYDLKQYAEAGHSFAKGYAAGGGMEAQTLYFSAAALLMGGAHAESIGAFERLFAAHPKAIKADWHEQYIHALIGGRQTKRALPLIREMIGRAAGDDRVRWQEIFLHQALEGGLHAEALAFARELVDQEPQQPRWWKALAHIHLASDRLADGLAALLAYSALTPPDRQETRLMADLFLQADIPARAAELYARHLQAGPDVQIVQRLAMAYVRMDRPDEALAVIARSGQVGSDPRLLLLQGEISYSKRRYAEAADSYRRAARIQGNHQGQAWLMAGYSAMLQPDPAASREALTRAAAFEREKKAATVALTRLQHLPTP